MSRWGGRKIFKSSTSCSNITSSVMLSLPVDLIPPVRFAPLSLRGELNFIDGQPEQLDGDRIAIISSAEQTSGLDDEDEGLVGVEVGATDAEAIGVLLGHEPSGVPGGLGVQQRLILKLFGGQRDVAQPVAWGGRPVLSDLGHHAIGLGVAGKSLVHRLFLFARVMASTPPSADRRR